MPPASVSEPALFRVDPPKLGDALRLVPGVSYRQADYWCRTGLLDGYVSPTVGTGHPRSVAADAACALWLLGLVSPRGSSGAGWRPAVLGALVAARGASWSGLLVMPLAYDDPAAAVVVADGRALGPALRGRAVVVADLADAPALLV